MSFEKISPNQLEGNVFDLIGSRWMLLTAGDAEKYNTMTVSWGGLGVLWGMNVATCYVRPQRYTRTFMEEQAYFTLSVYPEAMRDKLALCGAKSGRELDKTAACGFTPFFADCGAPCFEEAELVLVCKKLYAGDMDPACFTDARIADCYDKQDYHRVFIGEILEVLKKS